MSVKIFDSASKAYAEPQSVPKRYDAESSAYVETTGNAYDPDAAAWEEKWSPSATISIPVYGAVLDTILISDGTKIATCSLDENGCGIASLSLEKTYTFTGENTGYSVTEQITEETSEIYVMPDTLILLSDGVINSSWESGVSGNYAIASGYINCIRDSTGNGFWFNDLINVKKYKTATIKYYTPSPSYGCSFYVGTVNSHKDVGSGTYSFSLDISGIEEASKVTCTVYSGNGTIRIYDVSLSI